MELLRENLIPWVISNSIAILFLIAAIRKPKLSRLLFVLLFIWASWVNYTISQNNPSDYLNYASFTPFSLYRNFINGWFKSHVTSMVTIIAIGQGLIALGFLLKGWFVRLACAGAIVFFLAITPLGIGSGFPATIITTVAVCFILKNDELDFLWNLKTKK